MERTCAAHIYNGRRANLFEIMVIMVSGSEVRSYLRLIDPCVTQLKAQIPSRTCNESKEKEEDAMLVTSVASEKVLALQRIRGSSPV